MLMTSVIKYLLLFFLHGNMFLNVGFQIFKPALILSYPYPLKAPL